MKSIFIQSRRKSKRIKSVKITLILGSILICFFSFSGFLKAQTGTITNLALSATVSTSYVSPWETLAAVNDGYTPASSSDYEHGAYGNWSGEDAYNTYNWVQYEWDLAKQISSTSIYWWDDGGGIDQPTEAYVEYWNGTSWVLADSIGLDLDTFNSIDLDVLTSRIRVYMKSAMATGILEWEVTGIDLGPCDPSEVDEYVMINDEEIKHDNTANIMEGDSVLFSPESVEGGYMELVRPRWFYCKRKGVEDQGCTI